MTLDPNNTAEISADELARIDQVCLQFERDWRAGIEPKIEKYLFGFGPPLRESLLSELLLLDIDYRQRNGERPETEDYDFRLPDDGRTVESVFAYHDAMVQPDETPPAGIYNTTVDPATPIEPPQQLGRYRIIKKLGVGGFGSVYLATDDELQRDVAIKFPHWNQLTSTVAADRFLEEARILATLNHPAIVPVFDVGRLEQDSRICYVVSQLMDGGDLGEYLNATEPSIDETVTIVIRLAAALHYAHGKGLVHRDIKSSNILRDSKGGVFVSDFGLAIRDSVVDSPSGFVGTPAYMSPELARGEGHLVDGRTDIYSLGVIFYEMLVGIRPFRSSNVGKLLEQVQLREPKPPRQINDSIPKELERICLKSLSKQPADRHTTAADFASDLRAWRDRARPSQSTGIFRRPILVGVLIATLLVAISIFSYSRISGPPVVPKIIESLAVLPFQPLNMTADDEYLGLGISDTLITKLSNIRKLKVRPTGTIRQYMDPHSDPLASGRELGVDAVLEGTIQRGEGVTRATVRLLRVADGQPLWSATFDETSNDLFAIQDLISEKITQVLALELSGAERARIDRRYTESPAALDAYLRGRFYWNCRDAEGVRRAIKYYKQAIELDPLYALAHAGLAESYVLANLYGFYRTETAFPMGKAAAEQSLQLDPGLTEAVTTLAYVKFYYDFDWNGAEKEFLHAIELNPNYATAHQWYGEFLYFMGRFKEAKLELNFAGSLDPLSSTIHALRGAPYLFGRQYDLARDEFQRTLNLYPNSNIAHHGLAICYEQQLLFDDALKEYEQMHCPPLSHSICGFAGMAYVYARTGREVEARAILLEITFPKASQKTSPYLIATIHAAMNEDDAAIDWLQTAFKEHDELVTWVRVDPKLDNLREHPRFIDFIQEIGLAD